MYSYSSIYITLSCGSVQVTTTTVNIYNSYPQKEFPWGVGNLAQWGTNVKPEFRLGDVIQHRTKTSS